MSLYCMCQSHEAGVPDWQHFGAPNRYAAVQPHDKDTFPPLALKTKMVCIKTGARQVILLDHKNNYWNPDAGGRPEYIREHYPNVDVFECPNCRARIVKE